MDPQTLKHLNQYLTHYHYEDEHEKIRSAVIAFFDGLDHDEKDYWLNKSWNETIRAATP